MRKRLSKALLLLLLVALTVFALASCDVVSGLLDQARDLICEHEWVETERVDATCTAEGSVSRECTKCKKTETETIPVAAHSYELDEYGYREEDGHAHECTVCGAKDTVGAHVSSGPATADEHELCTVCGYVIAPALNHEHEYNLLEGDASGHWYECICGEKSTVSVHEGGTATCSEQAVCSTCGISYGSLDYTNHSLYTSSSVEATCAAGGVKVTSCHGCSYTLTETTPHLEHLWNTDTVSCTEGRICTRDGCKTIEQPEGHDYKLTASGAASCTEDGYETYTCKNCPDTYTNVVAHSFGHSVSEWKVQSEVAVVNTSCRYQLTYTGTCTTCGETDTKTEEVDRHEYRVTVEKEATCTSEGVKLYTCSVTGCGHSYTEGYTDENAHVWGEGVTEGGVTTYTCECGETKTAISNKTETNSSVSSDTLKDVGEVELKDASIALDSTTADALTGNVSISATTQKKDEVTDVEITEDMSEQIGESDIFEFTMSDDEGAVESFAGTVTVKIPYTLTPEDDPDCIAVWWLTTDDDGNPTLEYVEAKYSGGYVVFETKHFSYYTVTKMTPAERCQYRGHEDRILINPASCTEDGYETHICLRCGRTVVIEGEKATGHDFKEEYNEEATCTKHGKVGHKCNSCGKKNEEHKPALGHDWQLDDKAAASCTAPGHVTNKCSHCGELHKEVIPQKEHEYVVTTVEATCTEYGYTLHACKHCDGGKKDNYKNPTGHKYVDAERVEATCTEDGYIKRVCSCGDEKTEKIKKTGHMWNLKNPTCGEAKYCLICNHVDKVATGKHDMKGGICSVCGIGCDHKYVEVERVEATCIAEGKIVKACSCGSKTTEILRKVDHTWNLDAPTCGEDKYCTVCKSVSAAATGMHTIVDKTCSVCGSPCSHAYRVINVVAPACEAYGYSIEKCEICGDEKQTSITPMLGHTDGKVCGRCGKTLEIAVGYYTNMLDSFLNLGLSVELHDVVIYTEGSITGDMCTVELDELWLTDDDDGNVTGYGKGTITIISDGVVEVGTIKASILNDMFYLTLDANTRSSGPQNNAMVYPIDGTNSPVGAIFTVYEWYKNEAYPILSALIAANVADADRIIGGFLNAVCTETVEKNGNSVYTLDCDKVIALNEALAEKSIKEVYDDILGGSYEHLVESISELLDTTAYELLGSLEEQGVSREDILGAVYSFMSMMSGGAPMEREQFITETLAMADMQKTLSELLVTATNSQGTADELKENIVNSLGQLSEITLYELMLPLFGIEVSEYNVDTAVKEVNEVIAEAFGYFTLSTELSGDGSIYSVNVTVKGNEYVSGTATIFFGYEATKAPEDILDVEGYDEIMGVIDGEARTFSLYQITAYSITDGARYRYVFIAPDMDTALEIVEDYGFGDSAEITQVEVSYDPEKFRFDGIEVGNYYCGGWVRFYVDGYQTEDSCNHVDANGDGKCDACGEAANTGETEKAYYAGSSSIWYNTVTDVWATELPYEFTAHDIREDESKRVEPDGCTGLGTGYYYCEKCGVEYSLSIMNGHSFETTLELLTPGTDCEAGVKVTHECSVCGVSESQTMNRHYLGRVAMLDVEENGGCSGYIEVLQCACGKEGRYRNYTDCFMMGNGHSYVDEEGRTIIVQTETCYKCGLRIQDSYYSERNKENCTSVSYHSVIISIGEVAASCEYTTWSTSHDYVYTATLHEGAMSCEDGVTITESCRDCDYSHSYEDYWHREVEIEKIDLKALGCSCGGYAYITGCACGEYVNVDTKGTLCDFDGWHVDNETWIDGALRGDQYSTSGNFNFDPYTHTTTCAVTDPEQCGFVIRYTTYWLKSGCYAERYVTYQFGYDESTGKAAYEITYKMDGEKRQYHAYGEGVVTEGDNYSSTLYTCPDCGSTYESYNEYDNEGEYYQKNGYITVNKLNTTDPTRYEQYWAYRARWDEHYYAFTYADGSVWDYKRTTFTEDYDAPFGKDAYKQTHVYSGSDIDLQREEYAYTYVDRYTFALYDLRVYSDGSWFRNDYTYNPDMLCERTRTYTDSSGNTEVNTDISHQYTHYYVLPTCTQDGYDIEGCEMCGQILDKYLSSPAMGHYWTEAEDGNGYVCAACALKNENGADGGIILEDFTLRYGNGDNFVVGYYVKDNTTFITSVSILVMGSDGEYVEVFLDGIEVSEHDAVRAKVFSVAAVKAAASELGYADGEYLVRFAFVPLGADGSFDYAITFDEPGVLPDISDGEGMVCNYVKGGQMVEITITPEKTGNYVIKSFAYADTYGYLYDEYGNQICYDDDGGHNNNFRMTCYLEAGNTYVIKARWYSENNTGYLAVESTYVEK